MKGSTHCVSGASAGMPVGGGRGPSPVVGSLVVGAGSLVVSPVAASVSESVTEPVLGVSLLSVAGGVALHDRDGSDNKGAHRSRPL